MKASLELFSEEGFHSTSIADIAARAEISKGLLYNYFSSKEELLKEIAVVGFDEIYENFDPNHDGVLTDKEFEYFLDKLFSVFTEKKDFWKLYSQIMMQPDVMESLGDQLHGRSLSVIKTLMDYLKRKGFDEPENELFFLSSILKGALIQYLFSPIEISLLPLKKRLLVIYG
jgi:AcrR family transcriptional regulator